MCCTVTSFQAISAATLIFGTNHDRIVRMYLRAVDAETEPELDDLTPPSISFTRNSILFDSDAPTQRHNGPLRVWRSTKSSLPAFVTGAWEEGKGDRNPIEYLYNMVFIRIPTVLMTVVYCKNLVEGHGLILSFGEVPPVIVFCVIAIILR